MNHALNLRQSLCSVMSQNFRIHHLWRPTEVRFLGIVCPILYLKDSFSLTFGNNYNTFPYRPKDHRQSRLKSSCSVQYWDVDWEGPLPRNNAAKWPSPRHFLSLVKREIVNLEKSHTCTAILWLTSHTWRKKMNELRKRSKPCGHDNKMLDGGSSDSQFSFQRAMRKLLSIYKEDFCEFLVAKDLMLCISEKDTGNTSCQHCQCFGKHHILLNRAATVT